MNIKFKVAALAITAASFGSLSAAPKLQVVEILGNRYYVYEVRKGDSLYGIAKEYGWDTGELTRLNGKTVNRLEKGARLYYPVSSDTTKNMPDGENVDLSAMHAEPVQHVVKRGETVYSISRLYNIPVETIYKLCPQAKSGLKAGDVVNLSQKPIDEKPIKGSYIFYTIKPGDTLYSVAKTYGTTVESIMRNNPGIYDKSFKADETIKVPVDGSGVKKTTETVKEAQLSSINNYKVEKNDTWETISRKTGVNKEDLILANKESRNPKKNSVVAIPVIDSISVEREIVFTDPRVNSPEGLEDLYEEVNNITHADSSMNVKLALLMADPSSRKDLDVARGLLTAIDRHKRDDYKITFNVVDGSAGSTEVIEQLDSIDPTIVFYTAEKNFPSYLGDYAEVSQTPVVNLFDTKDDTFTTNPYVIQFLTPSTYFNEEVAASIAEKAGSGRTVVFVGNDEESDPIADILRESLSESPILTLTTEEFNDYPVMDGSSYLIYANPVKRAEVMSIVDRVIKDREEQPLADIMFVGKPSWIIFEESMKEKFFESGLTIPSRFYLETNALDTRTFVSDYKALFDHNPVRSYPLYAGVGYDMGNYFIPALAESRGDFNTLSPYRNPMQSEIDLQRVSNWSGFFNPACYLINYRPYGSVDKEAIGNPGY